MFVVFLHGPPASGKHTIGKQLSALLGVPLFHNHLTVDLALTLFDFGTPGFLRLREQVWLAAFEASAAAGQSFIFTFSPEATVDPTLIGRLERIIAGSGGKTHFVEVLCRETVIVERLANESRALFGKLRDVDLYRSLRDAGGFAFPALPGPLLAVDSATMSPESAARAIRDAVVSCCPRS